MKSIVTIKFKEKEIYFLLEVLGRFIEDCEIEYLDDAEKLFKKVQREARK